MKKMKKICFNYRVIKENWDFILLAVLLLFSTMNYFYIDSFSVITQSIELWNCLFSEGGIFTYNVGAFSKSQMIIMSIWQFPLFIIQKVTGMNVLDFFWCRVYGKMGVLLMTFWSAHILKLIAKEMNVSERNQRRIVFMFCSSSFVFMAVTVIGQVDIYGLFFTLLSLFYLMRGKKFRFFIFYLIAVQCKYFPFFILVPLWCLIEKNILKLLLGIVSPFVTELIINLPFSVFSQNANFVGNAIGGGTLKKMASTTMPLFDKNLNNAISAGNTVGIGVLKKMTSITIPLFGERVPLALIMFAAVCIYAYIKNKPDKNNNYWYVYISLMGIASVLLSYNSHPYRLIYMAPFIALIMMNRTGDYARRLAVEIIVTICATFGYLINTFWCFDFNTMQGMLIDHILPLRKFLLVGIEQIKDILFSEQYYGLWTLLLGVFVVWMIGLLYYNHPDKYALYQQNDCCETEQDAKRIDQILILRLILFFAFSNFTTMIYVFTVFKEVIRKIISVL